MIFHVAKVLSSPARYNGGSEKCRSQYERILTNKKKNACKISSAAKI